MLKNTLSLRLCFGAFLLSGLVSLGCGEQPELSFSEYGTTIDHLPVVEDLPASFPIANEIETKPCRLREEVETRVHRNLLQSQGRNLELEAEERAKNAVKEKIELPVEEPVVEEPVVEEPVVEEPVVEEPVVEEPVVEEPVVEEPVVEEPVVEEPVVEEDTTNSETP